MTQSDIQELTDLYSEDQQDRKDALWEKDEQLMKERDDARLQRVLNIVNNNELKTPGDFYHASMILQHGPFSNHYKMAHELAVKAVEGNYKRRDKEVDLIWLIAATKDRWLMSEGKPQLYGTQVKKNSINDPWYVYEVDPSITDDERAKYHVPPLKVILERTEKLNRKLDNTS